MAFECGFFDSTSAELVNGFYRGNKAKDASFLAKLLSNTIRSGYNPAIENCFKITPGGGMTVSRAPGAAFIEGYFCYDDEATTATLAAGSTYAYVLQLDTGNGIISEVWLKNKIDGTDYPIREGNFYDLVIAVIAVPPGAAAVTADMIADKRNDFNYCGYMKMAAASNIENIVIGADDILDGTNHMIPITDGDSGEFLAGNGQYHGYKLLHVFTASGAFNPMDYPSIGNMYTIVLVGKGGDGGTAYYFADHSYPERNACGGSGGSGGVAVMSDLKIGKAIPFTISGGDVTMLGKSVTHGGNGGNGTVAGTTPTGGVAGIAGTGSTLNGSAGTAGTTGVGSVGGPRAGNPIYTEYGYGGAGSTAYFPELRENGGAAAVLIYGWA